MMRVCNLDTCPVGIATQNPELRKRFKGKPEYVINFMHFIAQELREYMAKLGIRTVDELVGRSDLLRVKETEGGSKESKIDMTNILRNPYIGEDVPRIFNPADKYDFELEKTIDEKVIMKKLGSALKIRPRNLLILILQIQTVQLVQFLVQRLQNAITITLLMTTSSL